MSIAIIASSSQKNFTTKNLIHQFQKPKPKLSFIISCSSTHENDDSSTRRKNENHQLAKLAMVTLAAGIVTFGSVSDALAAKSGGRVGGQAFKSSAPPRASSPRPRINNNSRTNIYVNPQVAPPLVGGYGYGYGGVPYYGGGWGWSPFSFFAPGPSVAIGIGGGFGTLAFFLFLGAAAAVVKRFTGGSRRNDFDDDDDF